MQSLARVMTTQSAPLCFQKSKAVVEWPVRSGSGRTVRLERSLNRQSRANLWHALRQLQRDGGVACFSLPQVRWQCYDPSTLLLTLSHVQVQVVTGGGGGGGGGSDQFLVRFAGRAMLHAVCLLSLISRHLSLGNTPQCMYPRHCWTQTTACLRKRCECTHARLRHAISPRARQHQPCHPPTVLSQHTHLAT